MGGQRSQRCGRRLVAALAGGLLAAGCAVGPDYEVPDSPTQDRWSLELSEGLAQGTADLETWWTIFDDTQLTDLIARAREDGYDLQQAAARVRLARSGLGVAKGERVPQLDGIGSARIDRDSGQVRRDGRKINPGRKNEELFQLGLDSSWELDLWGRVRRSVESATADFEASIEAYRDTLVVIFAEVALNYVEVRTFQERIRYAKSNIDIQERSLDLTLDRRAAGLVGDLDVRQAELNLARTESLLPLLEAGLRQSIHRLSVLTGQLPSALYAALMPERPIPRPPSDVMIGIPAELLRQRPDIRAAERRVASASARIGVATADLYPRFSLSGNFTVDASSVGDLFEWSSRAFGIGPTFRWNLFSGGRVRAAIQGEEARTEEALADYEQTVLEGYEEAYNALVFYMREQERRAALQRSVDAAREGVRLVNVVYRQGLTEFQNVLDTEAFLFEQEDQLAISEGEVTQNLIRVYKALGGGWSP